MRDALSAHLAQISQGTLLNRREEVLLAQAIGEGRDADGRVAAGCPRLGDDAAALAGERAWHRLYVSNLRLVVSIARRYPAHHGLELVDLIQEGNLGLARAVDRFDWRRGFRFSTFATDCIHHAIGRAVNRQCTALTISPDLVGEFRAALRRGDALPPKLKAIERALNLVSVDEPLHGGGDGGALQDVLVSSHRVDEEAVAAETRREVRALVGRLPAEARRAVELRYGLGHARSLSIAAMSLELGVSTRAVRSLLGEALDELRRQRGGSLDELSAVADPTRVRSHVDRCATQ